MMPTTKYAAPLLLCSTVLALSLTACQQTPDCAEAVSTAADLGNRGQLANFEQSEFAEACQSEYMAAWEQARDAFCDPEAAFDRAMAGSAQPPACERPAYLRNHQLGANLHALRDEKKTIEDDLARGEADSTAPQQLQTWRMRLRVLEREVSELETLARMRGLMAPAELPPEVRDAPHSQ